MLCSKFLYLVRPGFLSFSLGVTSARQLRAVWQGFVSRLFPLPIVNNISYLFFPSRTTRLKMNDEYSYVGVPSTTQELTAKEDHDHSIQPSETHTVEAPAAPKLNAPALVGPFLL